MTTVMYSITANLRTGLYNGFIGTVIDIVYQNNPIGPNDKQHNHLPDYVVVDFLHLKLPPYIEPLPF